MRIAHVLSSLELGGQERVALDLVRAQRGAGHEVLVISLSHSPAQALGGAFRRAASDVLTFGRGQSLEPALVPRLTWTFSRHEIDVVHTHNPRALVYGAPAAWLANAVVIHTKHGMNPDGKRRRTLRKLTSLAVDRYVCVVESLADVARRQRECAPGKLLVIPNGIDLAPFGPDPVARREVRAELGVNDADFVVGSVGRLAPEKNQSLLIEATRELRARGAHLVLVGDGPLRRELDGHPNVHLPGARGDVPRWLRAFDAFALPSLSEGLPLALLEAMASGLPIVATHVGGVGDLVQDGVSGRLVPSGDAHALTLALDALERDRVGAREMGERARERVAARHSLAHMAHAYEALYASLVAARRLARARVRRGAPA